jgi:RNA polymerase sigma-70 factor (ECF subfamily)
MADLESFQAQRPRLFSMAYRMLGSASEAEDVLQDAWVRFNGAESADVRSPQAFAATIVTRLCWIGSSRRAPGGRNMSARGFRNRY